MYRNKSVLAVIPARGGSKGIPGKNIREFNGYPLIAYTINAALGSRYVDSVVVSTDSEKIAEISMRFGADVPFLRPKELADDKARTIDALVHAVRVLSDLGRYYDSVVLLQATSPLRRSCEIDGAVETFYEHGELGLASVSDVTENPVLTRRLDDASGILHPILPVPSTIRRQDMPKFYRVNGAIYINRTDALSLDTSLNDNPVAYVMTRLRASDIDSLEDFLEAESLMRELGESLERPDGRGA